MEGLEPPTVFLTTELQIIPRHGLIVDREPQLPNLSAPVYPAAHTRQLCEPVIAAFRACDNLGASHRGVRKSQLSQIPP